MQTKQQIQLLLESAGANPNKRLGQNFLIDLNLMRLLVDTANIQNDDVVLEVGCGTGSLTQALAERAGFVIAVEFDQNLAEIAKGQLTKNKNAEVINADILKNKHTIDPVVTDKIATTRKKHKGRFLLVANLPYSIASPLMLNLITCSQPIDSIYVTVQKEVAQRMTAATGEKHYASLSIILGATGTTETIRLLKPTVFWPQPQVDSAMVSFIREEKKADRIKDIKIFLQTVGLFAQHRRKMLKACTKFAADKLKQIDNWPQIFQQASINPKVRPQALEPEDFLAIANLCCKQIGR